MNNQTVPDDVIEQQILELKCLGEVAEVEGMTVEGNPLHPLINDAWKTIESLQRQREAVAQHEVEAVGEIVTTVMGDNDVCMIQWKGKYKPKKGDHIYAALPLPQDARELLEKARAACMEVHANAEEASKAKDVMAENKQDYIEGYWDAAIACDENIRALIPTEKEPDDKPASDIGVSGRYGF